MTTGKYLDLDAALAELDEKARPVIVRLYGQDWHLPGTPPAALAVRVARWRVEGLVDEHGRPVAGGRLNESHYALVAGDMIPGQILDEWSRRGLSSEQLRTVVDHVAAAYNSVTARIQLGEAVAPAKGASRSKKSSPAGRASRRTSNASTAST